MSLRSADQHALAEEVHNALVKSGGVIEPWMLGIPESLLAHIVMTAGAKPFDVADMLPAIEADGRDAFERGLTTAWIPYKATWQGGSTGEGQFREAWLRGWKAAEAAPAAQSEADQDHDDVEGGSLIWGQSVGTPYG